MWFWRTAGLIAFALGAIGLVLPVWPTTIFWIVAALAFARSNPVWAEWIYSRPGFGKQIRLFVEDGVLSSRSKGAALAGMTVAGTILAVVAWDRPWILGTGLGFIACGMAFVVTRPST